VLPSFERRHAFSAFTGLHAEIHNEAVVIQVLWRANYGTNDRSSAGKKIVQTVGMSLCGPIA